MEPESVDEGARWPWGRGGGGGGPPAPAPGAPSSPPAPRAPRLGPQPGAEEEGKRVERRQDLAPLVVDAGRINHPRGRRAGEQGQGRHVARHPVGLVHRHVARGRRGAGHAAAGEGELEGGLERAERTDDGPRFAVGRGRPRRAHAGEARFGRPRPEEGGRPVEPGEREPAGGGRGGGVVGGRSPPWAAPCPPLPSPTSRWQTRGT